MGALLAVYINSCTIFPINFSPYRIIHFVGTEDARRPLSPLLPRLFITPRRTESSPLFLQGKGEGCGNVGGKGRICQREGGQLLIGEEKLANCEPSIIRAAGRLAVHDYDKSKGRLLETGRLFSPLRFSQIRPEPTPPHPTPLLRSPSSSSSSSLPMRGCLHTASHTTSITDCFCHSQCDCRSSRNIP